MRAPTPSRLNPKTDCMYYFGRPTIDYGDQFHCGKKKKYKIVKDDDGYKVRKYNIFCEEHTGDEDEE